MTTDEKYIVLVARRIDAELYPVLLKVEGAKFREFNPVFGGWENSLADWDFNRGPFKAGLETSSFATAVAFTIEKLIVSAPEGSRVVVKWLEVI